MYKTDLNDKQWEIIKDLTERPDPRGAVRKHSMREILNAVLYINKTGCQWHMLPEHFPPYKTVFDHYRRMKQRGVWQQINQRLVRLARQKKGAKIDQVI